MVRAKSQASLVGGMPRRRPERIPEMTSAVPVAESQLKAKIASSGLAMATTGGARKTRLLRAAMGIVGEERRLRAVLTEGMPQRKTIRERMSQGIQARAIWRTVGRGRGASVCCSTGVPPVGATWIWELRGS